MNTQDLRVSAPYRFAPLNPDVVESQLDEGALATAHSRPLENGLSATLTVEWAAETPFLIGQEDGDEVGPFRIGGEYLIPGSSLRGMLRATMEIACFARLRQINAHHRYAIRDFQHPYYRSALLSAKEIRAGWLRREGTAGDYRWIIRPCDWKPVGIESLVQDIGRGGVEGWLKSDRRKKYSMLGALAPAPDGGFAVDRDKTKRRVKMGEKRMTISPDGEERYIVVSGAAVNTKGDFAKKVEYAFTDGSKAEEQQVSPAVWRVFEVAHSKPAKNKLEPSGAWEEWQGQIASGGEVPVFYSGELGSEEMAIGLTRLFRLPSRHSVGDLRDRAVNHRMTGTSRRDMVEALFGFVDEKDDKYRDSEPEALRGRIRFGFARRVEGTPKETSPQEVVMMGPRASFAPFYLVGEQDWSGDSWLAGRKRYPVRFDKDRPKALDDILARFARSTKDRNGEKISDGTHSRLRLLHGDGDELVFRGEIRLHNVTAEELGAVIWALKLGEGETKTRRHALGRGKSFGCGQMRVRSIGLRVKPNFPERPEWENLLLSARVSDRPKESEHWMPPKPENADDWMSLSPFATAFVRHMNAKAADWAKTPTIQRLLAAANPTRGEALRRADLLNYLGEAGADRKIEDGHSAHMKLKKTGKGVKLPWSV